MKKSIAALFFAFGIPVILMLGGCVPVSTPAASPPSEAMSNNDRYTIAEVEKLAGFDVKEPAYLPEGVSFDFATYQTTPAASVTLHFKITHETYGEMGNFFQIMQEMQSEAPPDVLSCGENTDGCEVLQINGLQIVYRLNPAGPEGLDWYDNNFVFRLLRTAGEPNKIYKLELMKVVESMQ